MNLYDVTIASHKLLYLVTYTRGSRRWWTGGPTLPPLKNNKTKGYLSNTGPGPLKNHIATKPAFNVGATIATSAKRYLKGFRWRADHGPHIVAFGTSLPHL